MCLDGRAHALHAEGSRVNGLVYLGRPEKSSSLKPQSCYLSVLMISAGQMQYKASICICFSLWYSTSVTWEKLIINILFLAKTTWQQ